MNRRRRGLGERHVREPCTSEGNAKARDRTATHGIMPDGNKGDENYEEASVLMTQAVGHGPKKDHEIPNSGH